MGTDIHVVYERKTDTGWKEVKWRARRLEQRNYSVYAFLAGVRNYSGIAPLAQPRGIPIGASSATMEWFMSWWGDGHTPSWFTVEELLAVNPDETVEDRRVMINNCGGCTCEPGEGEVMTLREFLGSGFFQDIQDMRSGGVDRIVFWFDC